MESIDNRYEFGSCRNCHISRKEKDKIKRFYRKAIGIKSETVLEELAENSHIYKLNAKTLLIQENEKVEQISFLYKNGDIVKAYYKNQKGKKQTHCFAHLSGEPLVGILNLDRNMTSFLTVETVTDCEIVSTSSIVIHRLAQENIEMQGVSAMREMEYRRMILTCTPMQKYEYFLKTYPELIDKISKKDIASYLGITQQALSRIRKRIF